MATHSDVWQSNTTKNLMKTHVLSQEQKHMAYDIIHSLSRGSMLK